MNEILEECLQAIEQGETIETTLIRYPEFANELRPILEAAVSAKNMAMFTVSADVAQRNRAKLLQRAAQMRDAQPAPANRWFPSFQRLAVALAMMLLFFMSGTSLVRAASSALPGDSLYSVKRSWEDVTLFFAFDAEEHETLEIEFENERLEEINDLFTSGRSAKVDFAGIVTRQNGDGWRVANILVIVSGQTDIPEQPVDVGAAVRVTGITKGDGIVLAEQIELLPAGVPLPEVEDDQPEIEAEEPEVTPQPDHGTSNSGVATETPELEGVPVIGARAKVEGYYRPDGVFVAIKIEIINNSSRNDDLNSNNNNDGNTNTNDDGADNDNTNSDDNDDDSNDDNDNDNDDNNNNGG
jgi:hypothetical protein